MESSATYTRRVNARRAGVSAGIPSERVAITVHKNGDEVRFGWKGSATPVKKAVTTVSKSAAKAAQVERNGVKRPKAGGVCAAVWTWLDAHPTATLKEAKAAASFHGWNPNNVSCEFYARRKFMCISGSTAPN